MVSVFISYTHRDSETAARVSDALTAQGIDVLMDRSSIAPGESWQRAVTETLAQAESVLLLLSPSAINSAWVTREYQYALDHEISLFTALVDAVPPEQIPHNLEAQHYVDLTHDFDENIVRLAQWINADNGLPGMKRLRQMAVEAEAPDSVTLQSSFSKQDADKLVEEIQESLKSGVRNIKVVKSDGE